MSNGNTSEPPDTEDARRRMRHAADRIDGGMQTITDHPWTMLGAAFGIGVLLGLKPGLRRVFFSQTFWKGVSRWIGDAS